MPDSIPPEPIPASSVTSGALWDNPLRGKRVVLGVCGGIAAYKSVLLLRELVVAEAEVQVVMTRAAQEFVGALTFQALSGRPVFTDLFSATQESEIGHIAAADRADLVIVAPATANSVAQLCAGLANDALSALVLATRAPVLLAPSMNVNMWESAATQRNVKTLRARGMRTVGPDDGFLACRWIGAGRLAEPSAIVEAARRVLTTQDLRGRRLLIAAGPTREPIDPVRFLSNRSTGRMGYALATAAVRRGAAVQLVSGPVSLSPPAEVDVTSVVSAAEMATAVLQAATDTDAVIMAAAVADFTPTCVAAKKLKKGCGTPMDLPLVRTVDVLAELGRRRGGGSSPMLVGFAAETESVLANARAKLEAKACDLIIANDVSATDAGFEVATNRVVLVSAADDVVHVPLSSKLHVAHCILDRVVGRLGGVDIAARVPGSESSKT